MSGLAVIEAEVVGNDPSPPELAKVANREYALAREAGESMVNHAVRAGAALHIAKASVGHGEWLPWLEANFDGSRQTAADWMRLAVKCSEDPTFAPQSIEAGLRAIARKAGNGDMDVHYSSATDDWETPQDLFDELDAEFGFDLDVCALDSSAKCERYFSPEDDGLTREWTGICWMNPPYGDVIRDWVAKAYAEAQAGATVVCLVPARVDTGWWWDHCRHGEIRFLRGRLRFGGASTGAPFPSALVIFGPSREAVVKWWER